MFNNITHKAIAKPGNLFLIDGFGALLSAVLLGVVLVQFQQYFGIPVEWLYFLASFPIVFALYDFYCYRFVNNKIGAYLKGIATANLLYCFLSIGVLFYHYESITILGWLYIIGEIMIVVLLAILELGVAKKLK